MFYSVAEMFSISIASSLCICIDFTPLVKYVHVKKHKENLRERVGWWIAAILPRAITFAPCVIKIRKSSKISNITFERFYSRKREVVHAGDVRL